MEGLQHRVQRLRAFRSVKEKSPFRGLDKLRLFGFEDARGARVLRFSVLIESISRIQSSSRLWYQRTLLGASWRMGRDWGAVEEIENAGVRCGK